MKTWAPRWFVRSPARPATPPADGTTTATVLAEAIYREGLKYVTSGANPIGIQRGINKAVAAAGRTARQNRQEGKDKEEIKQVATVSANWDNTIGEIIADAMDKSARTAPSQSRKPSRLRLPWTLLKACSSIRDISLLLRHQCRDDGNPASKTPTFLIYERRLAASRTCSRSWRRLPRSANPC
jgi:hypothetical protein